MDKSALLDKLKQNHRLFENLVAQVSEQQMLTPMGKEQLTGKDLIAHLTTWEQRTIRWLETALRGKTPQSPEPRATWDDMDRLNAQSLAQNKDHPLSQVKNDSHQSFQQLLTLIQSVSDKELNVPRPYAWLRVDEGRTGTPLWRSILRSPCYAHYQDHFYDFLQRVDSSKLFQPEASQLSTYVGTYASSNSEFGTLTFFVENNILMLRLAWQEQPISSISLDATRFAYEDFGLVTFYSATNDGVPTLEWWVNILTRTA